MEKKKARSAWRRRCALITPEEKAASTRAIVASLETLDELAAAKIVMAYAPLPDEVDIMDLLEDLKAAGTTIVFPLVVGDDGRMDAHSVTDFDADLKPGRFGLLQPVNGVPIDPRTIDVILVPAVAYDTSGHRLGRGGGYYDRFLSARATHAFRLGVAFECQVFESIPLKEHDCAVEVLVTEKCIRRFGRKLLEPGGNKVR